MKKLLLTLSVFAGIMTANAQQVNGSFDNEWVDCIPWTSSNNTTAKGTQPDGWTISNVSGIGGVGATQVGHKITETTGYSLQLINTANPFSSSQIVPAYITLGTPWATSKTSFSWTGMTTTNKDGGTFGGIKFSYKPDAIKFSYKRIHAQNSTQEKATVIAYLWKGTYKQYQVPGENTLSSDPKTVEEMDNRDRQILGKEMNQYGGTDKTANAQCIATIEHYIEGDVADWTELTLPFSYTSDNQPEMLNIIFASNNYFDDTNIGENNELWIDNVTLVYNSQLTSLSYDNTPVADFDSEKYEYTLAEDYDSNATISAVANGKGATIEQTYDPLTAILTITVKGNDWNENNKNEHTYTIQFNKPKAVNNYTNSLLVDATKTGVPMYPPTEETIQLIENANGSKSFFLKNFAFGGAPMGDILMTDLQETETAGQTEYTQTQNVFITGLGTEVPVTLNAIEKDGQLTANMSILNGMVSVSFAPALVIDGQSTVSIENAGLHNVTLSRTFPAGWSTICLPFATTTAAFGEEVKAQAFTSANADGLNFTEVTDLEANKPYLIYFKNETTTPIYFGAEVSSTTPVAVTYGDFTFCGSYEASISMSGKYGVADQGDVQKLMLGGEHSTLGATRAYFTKSGDQPAQIRLNLDGNTTAIDEVEQAGTTFTVYTLQGVLVREQATTLNGLPKGIYIVNGKKMIVK